MADPSSFSPVATLRQLIGRAPAFRKVLALAALASLTEGFSIVLLVPILAAVADGGGQTSWVVSMLPELPLPLLLGAVFVLVAIRLALRHGLTIEQARLQFEVVDRLRSGIFVRLLDAEWRWLSQQRQADHVSVLVTETGRIGQGVKDAIQIVGLTCAAGIYGIAAFLLSWETALVTALAGGLIVLISKRQRERARALGQSLGPLNRRVHRTAQESVQAIRMSKILGLEETEAEALDGAVSELRAAQYRYLRDNGRSAALGHIAMAALIVGSILFGIEVAEIGAATLLPMLVVMVRIVPALEGIQSGWQHWLEIAPAVDAAHALIAKLEQVAEPRAPRRALPFSLTREITVKGVGLCFEGRDQPALEGVDVSIPAYRTIAITGPSGSGKSTFADILMGLIVPDTGSVLVDGVPLSGDNRRQWRNAVAYVEQDAPMRNGTIRRNLTAAKAGAAEAEIRAVLDAASAGFVRSLPKGIDTEIGDNGVLLSGGERQRIALARALLRDPQLLILDEATNALDAENEAAIRNALKRLRGRMTIVIISHGSALIEDVDLVIRMEAGRLISVRPGASESQLRAVPR